MLQEARRIRELQAIGKLSDKALLVFLRSYRSGFNPDYDKLTGRILSLEVQRRKLVA